MAIRHHAYGFGPDAYLSDLRAASGVDRTLFAESLQVHAKAVVQQADEVGRDILKYLRYEEEWLGLSEGKPQCVEWLEISLIPHLRPLPSLSHREAHSYFVLDRILPTLGWTKADVDLLIHGKNLDS